MIVPLREASGAFGADIGAGLMGLSTKVGAVEASALTWDSPFQSHHSYADTHGLLRWTSADWIVLVRRIRGG